MASWIKRKLRQAGKTVKKGVGDIVDFASDAAGLGKDPSIEAQKQQQKQVKEEAKRAIEVQGRRTRETVEGFRQDADTEVANAIAMLGMTGAIDMTGGEKDTVSGDKIKFEKRKLPIGHGSIRVPVIEKGNRIDMGGKEAEELSAMRSDVKKQDEVEEITKYLGSDLQEVRNVRSKGDAGSLARGSSLLNLVQFRDEMEKDRRAIVRAGQEDLIGYQKTGEFSDKQMKLLDKAQSLTRMRNAVGLGMQVGTMVATGGYSGFAGGKGFNYGAGLLGFMTGQVVR